MSIEPIFDALVEVVMDPKSQRLRVRPTSKILSGWIRFPKHLRIPGAKYRVEYLAPIRENASWDARGEIKRAA